MWREDDVVEVNSGLVAERAPGKHIECCAGDAADPQRLIQCAFIDDVATCRVDQNAVGFISPNARAPTRLRVLSFSGQLTTRKSASVSTVSRSQGITPNAATSSPSHKDLRDVAHFQRTDEAEQLAPDIADPDRSEVRPVRPMPTYRILSCQRAARVIRSMIDAMSERKDVGENAGGNRPTHAIGVDGQQHAGCGHGVDVASVVAHTEARNDTGAQIGASSAAAGTPGAPRQIAS